MSRTPRGTRDHRSRAVSVVVVVGVVLACVLTAWAAVIGPSQTLRDGGPDDVSSDTIDERVDTGPGAQQPTGAEDQEPGRRNPWVDAVSTVAGLALLCLVVVWAARALSGRRRRMRERERPDEPGSFAGSVLPRSSVVTDHADEQHAALLVGNPRNAIVAMWQQVEQHVAEGGLPRRPSETSSEFTQRFLAALDADPEATDTLAGLYREARFSSHELTEGHRESARQALSAVHRSLGAAAR